MSGPRQGERWDELRAVLRPQEAWEAWLERSGEGPPDFAALPAVPGLPDPLAWGGRAVRSASEWPAQRAAILESFRHWVFGTWPEPPAHIAARVLAGRDE